MRNSPTTDATFPNTFPRIETARLNLREIRDTDAAAIFKNFSDPEVAKWFFETPLTEMAQVTRFLEAFHQDFEQKTGLTWAIALREDDRCIGTCGYGELIAGRRGEIGFDLAKDLWGKGLMAEALTAVIEYGLDTLALVRVEAHTYSNNLRAIRLLEKLGFLLEKVSEDSHHFSISREVWEEERRG